MRQRSSSTTGRGPNPRARRSARPRTAQRCTTEHAEARAKQIGSLYAEEARLVRELAKIRCDRDRELVKAHIEGVPGTLIGHATLVATGREQTEAELRRAQGKLRKAVYKAKQRLRVAAGNKAHVAARPRKRETARMRKPIYTREAWYSPDHLPPDAGVAPVQPERLGYPKALGDPVPPVPTLVGDDDLGDPDDDLDDEDDLDHEDDDQRDDDEDDRP